MGKAVCYDLLGFFVWREKDHQCRIMACIWALCCLEVSVEENEFPTKIEQKTRNYVVLFIYFFIPCAKLNVKP